MKLIPHDITSKIILLLSVVVIVLSVHYIQQQNRYSPIDEFSHFDYIEKLSSGHFPSLSDTINEDLFQDIKDDSTKTFNGKISFREQLGIGNYCYEAIHPPVYYLVLTVPDWLLKQMNLPVFKRLKVLRLVSYCIFVLGMFMCIPLFRNLRELGYDIPDFYAQLCVLFGLLIITNHRYGLGNNMMSPFIVNLCGIYLLKFIRNPINKHLYLFVLFSGLAILVAIGNIFIIPFLMLIGVLKFIRCFSIKPFIISILISGFLASLFLLWKSNTIPDPTINANFQLILGYYIPAGLVDYKTFFGLVTDDAFVLSFISESFNFSSTLVCLFLMNAIIGLLYAKTVLKKHKWVLFFAALFILLVLTTFLLNRYIARVHWVGFRHYLGFIPVIFVSVSFWILLLRNVIKNNTKE